jgi:hypothetical protein
VAGFTDMTHFHDPPRYDGAPHCVLCTSTDLAAGHEWCPASASLVCDECCVRLLHGDTARFIAIVTNTGRALTPEMLFGSCAGCERAARRMSEHILTQHDADSHAC